MGLDLIKNASKNSIMTLIGSIMCFSGLASLAVWTNINIYVFSYYYLQDPSISLRLFNIMISLTALIGAGLSLVSMQIGDKIGHTNLIKISMIIYPCSIIISS